MKEKHKYKQKIEKEAQYCSENQMLLLMARHCQGAEGGGGAGGRGRGLGVNLNVICAIQIISATLLVISISELKNIEPPPLVHMFAKEIQTPSF